MAENSPRFIAVVLRGALDGLFAVQPYGDPGLRELRAKLCLPEPGQPEGLIDLGGFFGLTPHLPSIGAMITSGDGIAFHAIGLPADARTRSHFDAQKRLETGAPGSTLGPSGWINRVLAAVPDNTTSQGIEVEAGLGVGAATPLLITGPEPYAPLSHTILTPPPLSFYERAISMAQEDGAEDLYHILVEALEARRFASVRIGSTTYGGHHFNILSGKTGKLIGQPDGHMIAVLDLTGFDTHVGEMGALPLTLKILDQGIQNLRVNLGSAWEHTVIFVISEFGRTARVNGSDGTDHGTGGVAFLLGGAVAGGRVVSTWPGLAEDKLFERRDLDTTIDYREVAKSILLYHMRLATPVVDNIFEGSAGVSPILGLFKDTGEVE